MIHRKLLTICAVTLLVTAFGYAAPNDTSSSYEIIPGVFGPPAGIYTEAQVLVPASFSPGAATQYRFKGQEFWIPFDRPLYLGAFAGEERAYTLEFQSFDGSSRFEASYIIDMQAPEPPLFKPASGDLTGILSFEVVGTGDLFISVDGSPFELLSDSSKFLFNAETDTTRIVSATAFAVDPAGNISIYNSARWRLSPVGLEPSFPNAEESVRHTITPIARDSGIDAKLLDLVSSAKFTIKVPDGTIPCVAVNSANPFSSIASYVELSATTTGTCLIPFPWGDDTEILVNYGYKRDGVLFIVAEPLHLIPRFPANETEATPSRPIPPSVRVEESTAFISWPATLWTILFAIGTEEFNIYKQPLRVQLGSSPLQLQYYISDQAGSRSVTSTLELPSRYEAKQPMISGIENGRTYGTSVIVLPQENTTLRYEFIEGKNAASPITASSPVLNQNGLRFDGKPGETVQYQLRILAESPTQPAGMIASTIKERFFSFTVDRQPPPVPEVKQSIKSFSLSDSLLSFKPQRGEILVSISEDGLGSFVPYGGPISISGSDEGRKRYIVRAYAEDEFGNRSKEMPSLDVLIDRSSLYVDAEGKPGASGSPDDPIKYLDDAIEAAQTSGKRFLYVRGSVALRRSVVISRPLTIAGGFDADWNDSSSSATISIDIPQTSSAWGFVVDGGSISLSSVSIIMNGKGSGGIVLSRYGPVVVSHTALSLSGGIDMTVLKSNSGLISVDYSTILLSDCFTARGIEANNAVLKISNSTVECDSSVKLFDAIRIRDADATISGLRLVASPSQALSVINSIRSAIHVESAVMSIAGGSSSCRIFSAYTTSLIVSSVYIEADWNGSAEAFNMLNGSQLKVAHLTVLVDSPKAVFLTSTGSTMEIYNSIASFTGIDSVFIRSDMKPVAGTISANSLWGFSKFLDGSRVITALPEFNILFKPSKINFSEDPAHIFSGSIKGMFKLSQSSACVDAGSVIEWASDSDVSGKNRNTPENRNPDIGAEEL